MFKISLIFCFALSSIFAINSTFADDSSMSNFSVESIGSSPSRLSLDASLLGIQYYSASEADTSFQQRAQLQINYEKSFNLFATKLSAYTGTFSLPRSSYFAAPEFFVRYSGDSDQNYFAIGRKIQKWSFADEQLHLGLYNSYFSNDLINYTSQGLLGFHGQFRSSLLGLTAGFFPAYLPNQGPQVYEEKGEIRSSNRWAPKPPTEFQFGSSNREIVYLIKSYDVKEIISNSGYALTTTLGPSDQRPWMQAAFSRKPISEIPLSRDTYGTAINFTGQVKLSPVVTYSQVRSLDFNVDSTFIKSTLSYLEDNPENKTAAEGETLQNLEPLKIYSIWISFDMTSWVDRSLVAEMNYSEINGGAIKDLQADGRPSTFNFSNQRTLFKKPFSLKVQTSLVNIKAKPIVLSVKWIYDDLYKGSLVSGLIRYEAIPRMNLDFGFDLLGVEDAGASADNFLKSNQANDRIYGGIDYVF